MTYRCAAAYGGGDLVVYGVVPTPAHSTGVENVGGESEGRQASGLRHKTKLPAFQERRPVTAIERRGPAFSERSP